MKRALVIPLLIIAAMVFTDAAADQKGDIADVSIGYGSVTWQPLAAYPGLSLSVAKPDGDAIQETFSTGVTPSFVLSGGYFPDGQYTWELRVVVADAAEVRGDDAVAEDTASDLEPPPVQSGYFTISQGAIVVPGAPEETDLKDIVHSDDVIIDGSLAIGNDAYSGLAFGFDTIALMENNLRIFFDDTSSIQNYPANDWRIIINDSTDGGGNYFAIEDATEADKLFVLEAGAPANSLYVDSHGDVGINTSTPYYELHIVDGDSPCVRLDQDGSYGWTPQKWDLCGNESNFFIRDATHASRLPFRIEPECPTDTIFMKSNGNVGIGTGSPGYPLELETTGEAATFVLDRTDGAMAYINAGGTYVNFGSCSLNHVRLMVNGAWQTQINTDGSLHMASGASCTTGGVWANSSSRELKENIENISADEAMEALAGLEPVKYNYRADKTDGHLGFIAEDVPDLVAAKDRKTMSPMDVTAVLTKVVQQQQKIVQEQQKLMQEQQTLTLRQQQVIANLQSRLEALEAARD
jgi:Chaperone of endosialidase